MTTTSKQSKTVLLVDDNKDWRETVAIFAVNAGYDVTEADNLQDAVKHVQRQRFYAYISDGEYPLVPGGPKNSDAGFQLYERIRQLHVGNLNYVIMSGNLSLQRKCEERGIRFWDKDDDIGSLLAYIKGAQ